MPMTTYKLQKDLANVVGRRPVLGRGVEFVEQVVLVDGGDLRNVREDDLDVGGRQNLVLGADGGLHGLDEFLRNERERERVSE